MEHLSTDRESAWLQAVGKKLDLLNLEEMLKKNHRTGVAGLLSLFMKNQTVKTDVSTNMRLKEDWLPLTLNLNRCFQVSH